jgi:hypothetical protein
MRPAYQRETEITDMAANIQAANIHCEYHCEYPLLKLFDNVRSRTE